MNNRLLVCVPIIHDPRDYRLCEILVDATCMELCICTGCRDNNGVLRFKLYSGEEYTEFLTLPTLRQSLVFFDRFAWWAANQNYPFQALPTIGVGKVDRRLEDGELFLDSCGMLVGLNGTNYHVGVMR